MLHVPHHHHLPKPKTNLAISQCSKEEFGYRDSVPNIDSRMTLITLHYGVAKWSQKESQTVHMFVQRRNKRTTT